MNSIEITLTMIEQETKFDLTIEMDGDEWNITKAMFFCSDTNDYIEAPRWLLSLINKSDAVLDAAETFIEEQRDDK